MLYYILSRKKRFSASLWSHWNDGFGNYPKIGIILISDQSYLGIWEWGGWTDMFRSLRMAGKGQNRCQSEMECSPSNCQRVVKKGNPPYLRNSRSDLAGLRPKNSPRHIRHLVVGFLQDKSPQSRDWETVPPKLPVNWDSFTGRARRRSPFHIFSYFSSHFYALCS